MGAEQKQRLNALRTKLEILLNPNEPDPVELLNLIDEIIASENTKTREAKTDRMIATAHRLLKREWVRLKSELQDI